MTHRFRALVIFGALPTYRMTHTMNQSSIEKDCKMREMHEILSIKISTKDSKLVLTKNYGVSLCEDGG